MLSLHSICLSMCIDRAITGYFSLAFTKRNKLDLSGRAVTGRYRCTHSPSTHARGEPGESPILRSPSGVKKQKILLSASIDLVQSSCLGTSAGLHPDNMDLRSSIHSCDLSLSCLHTCNSFNSSSLEHGWKELCGIFYLRCSECFAYVLRNCHER